MNRKPTAVAYLFYTVRVGHTPELLSVLRSLGRCFARMEEIEGDDVPANPPDPDFPNAVRRVCQKINQTTGQIWYCERHQMK